MNEKELSALKNRYGIVGNDPGLNRALEIAKAVAQTDITVLVTGESGVGKENIPLIIHQNSLRKGGKYFAVNCGAIPEGTVDSELFGHEKGSFTGAVEMRRGYFEEANGGTLFLDEIGELPLASQAKLLRVLQSGEFIRVGSSKVLKTDVRVIAATNVNLQHAVANGKFRADLYYRLCTIDIRMPALRDRKDDIYLLFRKFASDFADKYMMSGIRLSEDAVNLLNEYRWPGNIRQLKNVAESVSALESVRTSPVSSSAQIDAATLSRYIPKDAPNLLPAIQEGRESEWMASEDKELILRYIYQLKQEVDELKKVVYGQRIEALAPHNDTPEHHDMEWELTPSGQQSHQKEEYREEPDEQIPMQEETLDLKKNGDEFIRKAIEKYGSRKAAAEALGISERTLYRKLKNLERK